MIQGLHLNRAETAAFCRELEGAIGHSVQANAYYTPRGSQGLAVHHDTHDVFVLQISGEKRWLVYEPVLELPLKEQRYRAELGAPGEPVIDTVLAPGDTLYLPRGWLHEARTSTVDSLHLTVGINVYTWLDAFSDALGDVEDELAFRRSVASERARCRRTARASGSSAQRGSRRAAASRRGSSAVAGRCSTASSRSCGHSTGLTVSTVVERRPTALAAVEEDGDALALVFHGKRLLLPARLHEEAEFLAENDEPFVAADLPGRLDEPGRLVLIRRLVREGFLRIRRPDAPAGP